jgi:hypothetical protein
MHRTCYSTASQDQLERYLYPAQSESWASGDTIPFDAFRAPFMPCMTWISLLQVVIVFKYRTRCWSIPVNVRMHDLAHDLVVIDEFDLI